MSLPPELQDHNGRTSLTSFKVFAAVAGVLLTFAIQTITFVWFLAGMRFDIDHNKQTIDVQMTNHLHEDEIKFGIIRAQQDAQDKYINKIDSEGSRKLQLIEDRQNMVLRTIADNAVRLERIVELINQHIANDKRKQQ